MKNVEYEAIHDLRGSVRYYKELTGLARKNRSNPTEAEKKIWEEILKNDKTGFRFLRQKPIYRFILDFYCSELSLAIEIDGGSHENKKGYDEARDKYLNQIGVETIRFTNNDILIHIEDVKAKLKVSLVKGRFRGIEK